MHEAFKYPYGLGIGMLSQFVKRKAFFSFDYDDIMRVNVVRNAWMIDHPDSSSMRSFYDSSLWESRKAEGDDAVKRLIREGQASTSAVCVLVGTNTWLSRWVRYEIARSVIDERGLLAVHINGINHHVTRAPSPFGPNPVDQIAIGPVQATPLSIPLNYLWEWKAGQWVRYADYMEPVKWPPYLQSAQPGFLRQISQGTALLDWVQGNGHSNIGAWIDAAAKAVGR